MAAINWDAIMDKAARYMETDGARRARSKIIDKKMLGGARPGRGGVHTPDDAAEKFISVLHLTIQSSDIPPGVMNALDQIDHTKPYKVGDRTYRVRVYFSDDTIRESMSTKKDYYPVDLAELYNDGVDHVMQQIFEHQDNVFKISSAVINGAHFMEQSIEDFLGNYGDAYNVIGITIETPLGGDARYAFFAQT